MDVIYYDVVKILLFASACVGVIGGFKIYEKWNRGEEVVPLIFSWVLGLSLVNIIFYMVGNYIVSGGYKSTTIQAGANELSKELYESSLIIGVVISIFSIVRIYQKHTDGEDVYGILYKWLGSLIFLFVMGTLIEKLLT